jgi:hypothetical protein
MRACCNESYVNFFFELVYSPFLCGCERRHDEMKVSDTGILIYHELLLEVYVNASPALVQTV